MTRALITLIGDKTSEVRVKAMAWIRNAPAGTRVEFKAPRRSWDQNAKMWACLTDIAQQVPHYGLWLSAQDWKLLFLDALRSEQRIVPNLDGNGFVSLTRSSDLSRSEMSDLLELIAAWGAAHGVRFGDDEPPKQEEGEKRFGVNE